MSAITMEIVEVAAAVRILISETPNTVLLLAVVALCLTTLVSLYTIVYLVAPQPRHSTKSERQYRNILADGTISVPTDLPCWLETWQNSRTVEPADLYMSVVVPAYNESERLPGMLEEAVAFLEREYSDKQTNGVAKTNGLTSRRSQPNGTSADKGWEIIIVSDGSRDNTVQTALDFARRTQHTNIKVVELEQNRGKGGAVTHGMKHVRGRYAIFADADGASKFDDLQKMVAKAQELETIDPDGRAVVVGSRAHLVGSEAVVKRSLLRNALMYTFHLFIRLLTTRKTSQIGDTQCGFKLFTRPALPHIIPYMHTEGWIFDVEMLMLTEAANIPMQEVPVGWKEVPGSKLNVIWDSLAMAWGLAIVRSAWSMGIWKRI